ncbi:50S ribosomal protein L23 [archaeon]|nr:MAG: 50S ribosomal protein L23 [archaeon]
MDSYKVLRYPHMTEKSVSLVEKENKIVFIVNRNSTKTEIKQAVEKAFEVKVDRINTEVTMTGEKKAYIKLKSQFKAADVAVKLGII